MESFIKTWKTTYQLLKISYKVNKRYFYGTFLACIFVAATPVLSSFLFGQVLTKVTTLNVTAETSGLIAVLVFYGISRYIEGVAYEYFLALSNILYRYDVSLYFTEKVIEKVAQLDIEFFENPKYSDLKAKALDSFEYKPADLLREFFGFFRNLMATLFAGAAILYIYPLASLFIIIAIIPGVIVDFKFQAGFWGMWSANTEIRRKYGYLLEVNKDELFVKDMRLLNVSGHFRKKIVDMISDIQNRQKKVQNSRSIFISITYILPVAVSVGLIYLLSKQVIAGTMMVGTLSFYIANLFNLRERFGSTLFNMNSVITESRYLGTLFEFLKIPQLVQSKPDAIKDIKIPPSIEFKDVSFTYPGSEHVILKDFNLKIEAGQKIAIVGENGAGKSTLIKLVLRFYDVTTGEILVNGISIKELDIVSWRKKCAVLLQDFVNFRLSTVEDNIGFGNLSEYETLKSEDSTTESVIASAKDAKAHDFISKNKSGYKEPLGREFNGVDFSGGEHQRLALARTFYRNAGLIVMDEPTSAVDAKAESEIFQSIKNHLSDKTVIFVSHRFSTVRIADRIVVVENGKIEEDGSHTELMQHDGLYKKMFTLQAEGYK
jgi:ATP-binding cassette subfamily B protein